MIPKGHEFELVGDQIETYTIELDVDYKAYVLKNGKRSGRQGNWSMIYDQAMTIVLDEPTERITTNFKYTIKDSIPKDMWSSRKTGDYSSFDSICSETMVGFWQAHHGSGEPSTSCVIGRQIQKDTDIVVDSEKSNTSQTYFKVKLA